jgi:hypothetical protein
MAGCKVNDHHLLPNLDRTYTAVPEVGKPEGQCHSQFLGGRLLGRGRLPGPPSQSIGLRGRRMYLGLVHSWIRGAFEVRSLRGVRARWEVG